MFSRHYPTEGYGRRSRLKHGEKTMENELFWWTITLAQTPEQEELDIFEFDVMIDVDFTEYPAEYDIGIRRHMEIESIRPLMIDEYAHDEVRPHFSNDDFIAEINRVLKQQEDAIEEYITEGGPARQLYNPLGIPLCHWIVALKEAAEHGCEVREGLDKPDCEPEQ